MAMRTPPSWLQAGSHTAENDRLNTQGLVNTAGVSAGTNDLLVTQSGTPAMTVSVAAGWGWVLGTTTSTQGMYSTYNDAATTLTVTTANPTNPRIDIVCMSVRDAAYTGASNDVILQVVAGTAAASPTVPATPASSIVLAQIAVAAGATSIVNANITDVRTRAKTALPISTTAAAQLTGIPESGVTNLVDDLASKMSYALPTNVQTTTTYTAVIADQNKVTTLNNASAVTVTIPPQSSVVWVANTVLRYSNLGAGVVTFAGGAGVTVTNTAGTLAQYQSADLIRTGSDAWTVLPFAGGSAKATVSSTTGSPTITTVGSQTCYLFSGSGSITCTAGSARVLIVSGGGGGGTSGNGAGGGGAGGMVEQFLVLTAGTVTVTVGSGGAIATNGADSSFGSYLSSLGGGKGGNYAAGAGSTGGSGGGGGGGTAGAGAGASGTTASYYVTGFTGGNGVNDGATPSGGGGGGASANGGAASPNFGGTGGAGRSSSITGSAVTYAGGGAGRGWNGGGGTGGAGGGGNAGASGTANTGGGGGGNGGSGGSGVVILLIG